MKVLLRCRRCLLPVVVHLKDGRVRYAGTDTKEDLLTGAVEGNCPKCARSGIPAVWRWQKPGRTTVLTSSLVGVIIEQVNN